MHEVRLAELSGGRMSEKPIRQQRTSRRTRRVALIAVLVAVASAAIIALVAPGSIVPGPIRGVSRNYACTRAGGRSMVAV
ncbi:hypothetical protein A5785_14300 [Gordonia sp. 852002-50395_SCH5434458]|nr:hypothetical protein A5785_14300 [Gordonia sp. 852002-50395_SCH5434458]